MRLLPASPGCDLEGAEPLGEGDVLLLRELAMGAKVIRTPPGLVCIENYS